MSASTNKVKIILVQPKYPTSPWQIPHLPVGLGYLAEQLEENNIRYEVSDIFIDGEDILFEKIEKYNPEYIGISIMSLDIYHHYKLIEKIKIKFPSIKTLAGGPHISFVKEKAFEECIYLDFAIVYEGEYTIVELLRGDDPTKIKSLIYRDVTGHIVSNETRPFIKNLDEISFPKYSKFELANYGCIIQITSSRGCPFSCTFCGAHLSMGKKWRARGVEHLMNEMIYWYDRGYQNYNFVDSNFFMSTKRIVELCDSLTPRNLSFTITSDGMRGHAADFEMIKKMKDLGLKTVAIGVESANNDILRNVKKAETIEEIEKGIKLLNIFNISVIAFFIIGLPGETIRHVIKSFFFALKMPNISTAYFFNINPQKGTELYEWAREKNYLIGNDKMIYDNIGGMSKEILIVTPELSLIKRKILYFISGYVSRLVSVKYMICQSIKRLHGLALECLHVKNKK